MSEIKKTIWKQRGRALTNAEKQRVNAISDFCGVSRLIAEIAFQRGYESVEAAYAFFHPSIKDLRDPFELPDMETATERIIGAINDHGKICIYGDYDCDGTSAVSILVGYLKRAGANVMYRIPNRLKEGYGLNFNAVDELSAEGVALLITVDNGIAAHKTVDYAASLGIDVIITDHHECQGDIPEALAVIDAKRLDTDYPFREMCGAGIAYKLVCALESMLITGQDLTPFLEVAALATVADIVPLRNENRVIVSLGIRSMNENLKNLGIRSLIEVGEIEAVSAGVIGFNIGPKINAAGRLGDAGEAVKLFLSTDQKEANQLALSLREKNKTRQDIEKAIYGEACDQIEKRSLDKDVFMIVDGKGWHSGVIGIVASKLQEKWYHPVIVIGIDENGEGRGSCRSVEGINIHEVLCTVKDLFTSFGGHEMAAGFSMSESNIDALRARLNIWSESHQAREHLTQTLYYDIFAKPEEISLEMMESAALCEPFGVGNPGIVVRADHVRPSDVRRMGMDNSHLLFRADGVRCVAFGKGERASELNYGNVSLLGAPRINEFREMRSPELMIKDIKSDVLYQNSACYALIQKIDLGETIEEIDLSAYKSRIIPTREDAAAIFRYLKSHDNRPFAFDELKALGEDMNSFKILACLKIFQETDIISYSLKKSIIFSKICPNPGKKDINKAPFMIKLNHYIF